MENYKMGDPERIIKKVTNTPIMAFFALIVSIVFFIMFAFGVYAFTFDSTLAIVLSIVGGIFAPCFFLIYFFQKRKVKNNIKDVDLNRVRREIMEGVYEFDSNKTYFTRSFIMSNYYYGFIVEYKDILWVYDRVTYDPNTLTTIHDLAIYDNKGKKYFTTYQDIYIDEILKHNKNVLVGKENKAKYKEMIKGIKG